MMNRLVDLVTVGVSFFTFRFAIKWFLSSINSQKCEKEDYYEHMELLSSYYRYVECTHCFSLSSSQCNSSECSYLKSLRYMDILCQAQNTLDVCIQIFTYDGLLDSLVNIFHSGVRIRIIIDHEMSMSSKSKLIPLKEKGLNVRRGKSSTVMHHKFIIIDKALFVTGSLNWTKHALLLNTEHILVSNNKEFIEKSRAVFEKIWSISDEVFVDH